MPALRRKFQWLALRLAHIKMAEPAEELSDNFANE